MSKTKQKFRSSTPLPTFSKLCAQLGCVMTNFRDRWSAKSVDNRRVIFTVWEPNVHRSRYVFGPKNATDTRAGSRELREHIRLVIDRGAEAYGIPCEPKDRKAITWSRKKLSSDALYVLHIFEEGGKYVARIVGEVSSRSVLMGTVARNISAISDAFDDLEVDDAVSEDADRALRLVAGYRRDPKVRKKVLSHAKGICEYCGEEGFEKTNGERYLETHHIISLSAKGKDTVRNVIALCPKDHRQAHFGKNASKMEKKFHAILEKRRP